MTSVDRSEIIQRTASVREPAKDVGPADDSPLTRGPAAGGSAAGDAEERLAAENAAGPPPLADPPDWPALSAISTPPARPSDAPGAQWFEQRRILAVPPEALWPMVADTERINRAVGFPPIAYTTRPRSGGGTQTSARFSLGPLPLPGWREAPFHWQWPRYYYVIRDYLWGPLRRFRGGIEMELVDDGKTAIRVWAEMTPRHAWDALGVRFAIGPQGVASGMLQCVNFERYLLGDLDDPFPQLKAASGLWRFVPPPVRPVPPPGKSGRKQSRPAQGLTGAVRSEGSSEATTTGSTSTGTGGPAGVSDASASGGSSALEAAPMQMDEAEVLGAWANLSNESGQPELVARLRRYLLEAPDEDVVKMRPFELADRWRTDRRDTLVLFLRGTTNGLLQMTWDVMCPNCRIAKAQYASLKDLQTTAHCDTCDISYDANFDRSVEVRFTVAPAIRRAIDHTFCIGGPMNTPHIISQFTVGPGATHVLSVTLGAGDYRLRTLQCMGSAILDVAERAIPSSAGGSAVHKDRMDPSSVIDVYTDRMDPGTVELDAGELSVTVANHLPVPATLELERREWPDTAATAALVSTLQEFRDLFSSEVLAPGIQVAIQRLAFIFTDLSGSTAMYQRVGQARAFRIVQDHFRVLFAAVADHRGAVVKTIGDAVMATFPSPNAALSAALAIQREIRALDTGGAVETSQFVKIGIHQGPCVAVTANERLDYFGTTVNVAARVEHECRGGEITITADVRDDPAVAAQLAAGGFRLEPDTVQLRGIREPVHLFRIVNPCLGADSAAAQPQ